MSRKKTSEHNEGEAENGSGPGANYVLFVTMEDVLDKLKLLNYDTEFVSQGKNKLIHRHYFASPTNPGEQFHMFSLLSAWLIEKSGRKMAPPQEYDDPNSTISTILDHLRQMGVSVEFFPNKLKPGWGESVIYVLDKLTDLALKESRFAWKRPTYPEAGQEEEPEDIQDEAELTLEKVEEEMMEEYENEDDDEARVDELRDLTLQGDERSEGILHSNTTSEQWRLELERVLPQLKVTINPGTRDWRSHIELMHEHRSKIDKTLNFTEKQLQILHDDISKGLEKISSREKYLNNQLEPQLLEFRNLQNIAAEKREQYRQVSGRLVEKSQNLAQISDDLDRVKQKMEEKGTSMTDGAPLVNIRKSLTRVRQEVTAMDVRTGVVEQKILQAKLKDKSNLQKDLNAPVHNNMDLGLF